MVPPSPVGAVSSPPAASSPPYGQVPVVPPSPVQGQREPPSLAPIAKASRLWPTRHHGQGEPFIAKRRPFSPVARVSRLRPSLAYGQGEPPMAKSRNPLRHSLGPSSPGGMTKQLRWKDPKSTDKGNKGKRTGDHVHEKGGEEERYDDLEEH